jgi:hypothetical protein
MLFNINQINTRLARIEEIPNTFFENLPDHDEFGYELLPDWFQGAYGNLIARGLYAKAERLFNAIKATDQENEIRQGYTRVLMVEEHCSNVDSILYYCDDYGEELRESIKEFFDELYKCLDKPWFKRFTRTNVIDYLREFKSLNSVFICPICGNEIIKSNPYEARASLDHWQCKSKYQLSSVYWQNLVPMGEGCNKAPVKGANEVFWTNNDRTLRQTFFYPYTWNGEINIGFNCRSEPNEDDLIGDWEFSFIGQSQEHQDLIDKWNKFFRINDRWRSETLKEYLEVWYQLLAQYIITEGHKEDVNVHYRELLSSYRNSKNDFNLNPVSRVHWLFLNYLVEEAPEPLYESYKTLVISHINLI